jgi:thioredoxin-related protein
MQRRMTQSLFSLFGLLFFCSALFAADASDKERGKFIGAKPTEYPKWFKESFLDFMEDVAEAKAAGKRLMVLFHQDGCPYCNVLVERNLSQKDIETLVQKNFDVVALNMWDDREVANIGGQKYTEKSFAAALKVQFTPTILFFNEEGKVILRLNGYLPPPAFKLALEYVAGKHETSQAYQDYIAQHQKPKTGGKLISEPYFLPAPYDLSKSVKNGKPFAIFFEQTDCPACETLHGSVLSSADVQAAVKDFDVIQIDMWSDTNVIMPDGKGVSARELAKQLDVKYAPTIVIFNPQGKEVIRSEAFFKVFHTRGLFTYVSSGAYAKEPSFQRYLSGVAHDLQAAGKNVDIWTMEEDRKK